MRTLLIIAAVLLSASVTAAQPHLYLGAGYDFGGDRLAETDDSQKLRAGQGLSLTAGVDVDINPAFLVRGTLGYKWDAVEAKDGEVEFKRMQWELLGYHFFGAGVHGLGAGVTQHRNVKYRCDVDFLCSGTAKADDVTGIVVEYLYRIRNDEKAKATIGIRAATGLDYDFGGTDTVNGNYMGANIGMSF